MRTAPLLPTQRSLPAYLQKYYHPSNARFWFYGDDEPEERLRRLGEYLDEFDAISPDSAIPIHPRFTEPKTGDSPHLVFVPMHSRFTERKTANPPCCPTTHTQ